MADRKRDDDYLSGFRRISEGENPPLPADMDLTFDPQKPAWSGDSDTQRRVDLYRQAYYRQVAVLRAVGIPEVMTGYILKTVGMVDPEPSIVVRRYENMRLGSSLEGSCIELFDPKIANPGFLRDMIDHTDIRGIDNHARSRLKWLAQHLDYYRQAGRNRWLQAREQIQDRKIASRSLHDLLTLVLYINRRDPAQAYYEGIRVLGRLVTKTRMDEDYLAPIKLRIPFLKNKYPQPDRVEYSEATLDRRKILYLIGAHLAFITAGPPHSGKSTFLASLVEAIRREISVCRTLGLLGGDEVTVKDCDLDLSSPTQRYIKQGRPKFVSNRRPWRDNLFLVGMAEEQLEETKRRYTLTFGDGPGGDPDDITDRLARIADFAISVDRLKPESVSVRWNDYFLGPNLPSPLIGISTLIDEPNRESGAWVFESESRGDGRNFLSGQVVGLKDLKPDPENHFVQVASKLLLYQYLPDEVSWERRWGEEMLKSLQLS